MLAFTSPQLARSTELLQVVSGMESKPLLVITTRLPPQLCGVGTFSWLLDRSWPADTSDHRFVVVDGAVESQTALNHPNISEFAAKRDRLARVLADAGSVNVLLHYAGRAYHRLGCPIWLPSVLREWKAKFPVGRLTVFFHEVPGKLPFTSRHYWLSLGNRSVIRRLAQIGDVLITNTTHHAATITKIAGRRDVQVVPVGSNIEPEHDATRDKIRTEFVILGLPFARWETLQMFGNEIRSWQKNGTLTKLHLIGPPDTKFDSRSNRLIEAYPFPAAVTRHGELAPPAISRLLYRARFALTNVNELTWSKSSAFNAYAAHGCAIVAKSKASFEPLSLVIAPDEVATVSSAELDQKAAALREWFGLNATWPIIARQIFDIIATARPT
jgi:hypothetical protein